jgi:thiopurine S-methyltransferase
MDPSFWHERWQRNEIGFHQPQPHKALERLWSTLELPAGSRVFVPLAGKSLDLVWLARRGHAVVGIELSLLAVQAFHQENGAVPGVDLRAGDLFELTPASLGPIAAVFDRGSLVALPAALRRRYAALLSELSPPGTRTLLVTMEYEAPQFSGPPHHVPLAEVRDLFGATHDIEFLERDSNLDDFPKFAQRGVTTLSECCYRLTRRS